MKLENWVLRKKNYFPFIILHDRFNRYDVIIDLIHLVVTSKNENDCKFLRFSTNSGNIRNIRDMFFIYVYNLSCT